MKRTWLEKILIWILTVTMLITNVDLTAFTVMAEELSADGAVSEDMQSIDAEGNGFEAEPAVDDVQPMEEITSGEGQPQENIPQEGDVPAEGGTASEEQGQEQGSTEPEILPEDIQQEDIVDSQNPDEMELSSGADQGVDLENELVSGIEPLMEELSDGRAAPHALPVWYEYMLYTKRNTNFNVGVDYKYNNKSNSDTSYVWIYGEINPGYYEKPGDYQRIAYCIEPGVPSTLQNGKYEKHEKPLTEHKDYRNEKEKAKKILEYAYFGAEYTGHHDNNNEKIEYFMAAQELIWETIGATKISWYLHDQWGNRTDTLDTTVDNKKAEIQRLVNDFHAKPEFEQVTLYQDKRNPDKVYKIKLKTNSPGLSSWKLNDKKLPKGVSAVNVFDREIQFKMSPNVNVGDIEFEFTKTPTYKYCNMYYYTKQAQQTLVVAGTVPALSCECSAKTVPVSRVKIKKVDDAGNSVQGVTFRYGTSKTELNNTTKATDENGETEITLELSGVNTIYVQELEVPSYLVKSDEIKAVTFNTGGVGTVTFVNDRVRHSVTLKKINSYTGEALAGAVFRYWENGKPETMDMAVTDENGSFTSGARFLPGAYVTMEEVSAPPGYETPAPPYNRQEIRIDKDDSKNVFQFSNTPKYAELIVEKYNKRTGEPIRDGVGCKFRVSTKLHDIIYNEGGTIVELGKDGFAHLGRYPHGTLVFFKEIEAPQGYELNGRFHWAAIDATETTEQKITINKKRVPNEQITVRLRLRKKGSDGRLLQGVRFRLEQYDGTKWYTIASDLVTDADGIVNIPGEYDINLLLNGQLQLVEEETVPGYKLMDAPIKIDEKYAQGTTPVIEIEGTNEKIPTRFTVYKYDEEKNTPLAGAVFKITDEDGDPLQTITTNSSGYAETTELLTDVTYYIEEIEAPRGYQKAEGRQPFMISSEGDPEPSGEYRLRRDVPNKPYKGRIRVKKTNQAGISLPGIEFTIYKGTQVVEKLETDTKGEAVSKWLNADSEYRIRETYTPPQFDKTELLNYTFDFLNIESGQLGANWKVDVEKNETAREITASFTVENRELLGNVTIKKIDAEEPEIKVEGATFDLYNRYDKTTKLRSGTTDGNGIAVFRDLPIVNLLVDPKQGHYYLVETTPGKNHVLPEETGMYFSLTAEQLDHEIIVKNPPVKGSVELLKVDKENPDKKLNGAEFAIYKKGDLNNAVQIKTTDKNGWLCFENLRYGDYIIKEKKAPENYHNDMTGYPVKIEKHKQVVRLTVENPKKKMQVKVFKKNQDNNLPIGFVRFHIMSGDGKILETITTNTEGIALSQPIALERFGKDPYVVEAETVPGYEPNNRHYPIRVEADSTQEIQISEVEVGNVPGKSDFKIRKVNEEGEPVRADFRVSMSWKHQSVGFPVYEHVVLNTDEAGLYDFGALIESLDRMFGDRGPGDNNTIRCELYEDATEPGYKLRQENLATITVTVIGGAYDYSVDTLQNEGVTYDEDTLTLTVVNEKLDIRLNLVKRDSSDPDKYLEGAVFKIYAYVHAPVNIVHGPITVTTTGTPEGIWIDLPYADEYKIEEIKAPPGYYIGETTWIERSDFKEIKDGWVVVGLEAKKIETNTRMPELKIRKIGDDGKPLDALFAIEDVETGYRSSIQTKAEDDGYGTLDPEWLKQFLNPAPHAQFQRFLMREIEVDPHYERMATDFYIDYDLSSGTMTFVDGDYSNPPEVTVHIGDPPNTATIEVVNKRKTLKSHLEINKRDGNGKPAEAVFELREENYLHRTWEIPTKDGKANLDPVLDELIYDEKLPTEFSLAVYETKTQDGLGLYSGKLADLFINSDAIEWGNSGKFRLENRAPIVKDITQDGDLFSFTVQNETLDISLNLVKKEAGSTDKYLAGAKFEITPEGYDPIQVTTNDSPTGVKAEKLPRADSYAVQEIQAPEGYILDPTIYTYTLSEFSNEYGLDGKTIVAKRYSATHTNKLITGNVRVRKVDAQNGSLLNNAVFEIRKGTPPQDYEDAGTANYEKVGDITIGTNGIGEYTNLPYGKYFLREVQAPVGYQLSHNLIPFTIEQAMQTVELDVPNRRMEGKLTILKVDGDNDKKPLEGAVFTIHREETDEQVGDELVTNAEGKIGPVSLPYGRYYFKEVRFPVGYASATGRKYPFQLDQTHAVHVEEVQNTQARYGIRIYKRDGNTRKSLAGAVFGLFKDNGNPQTDTPLVTFRSNAGGIATTLLSEPGAYDVYELTPPPGYQLLTGKIDVFVDDTTPTLELDIDNYRQMLTVSIRKQEEGKDVPLAGAVFEIRNERTGELVTTTEPTGDDGMVTVDVPAGDYTYTVTEITAPDGYVLDSTPHTVIIRKGENAQGNITYEADPLVIGNKRINGNIKLVKVDKTNKQTRLAGAVFEVRDANGKTVDVLTTNSQGEAMSKNLQYGNYTLIETKAPEGYELDDKTKYQAELSEKMPLVTITADNTPKKGGFTVKKVDAENKEKTLPGAEFTIFKSYEDAQALQSQAGVRVTDADGLAKFADLDYGTYYVRETKAPKGYQLNNRIMAVTVSQEWQTAQPLVALDYQKPDKGYFCVVKSDKVTGSALEGAKFTVTGPDNYEKIYRTDKSGSFQTELLNPGIYTVTETAPPEGYYLSDIQERTKTVEVVAGAGTLVEMQELTFENEQILLPIRIKKTDGDAQNPKPLVGAEFKIYRLDGNGVRLEPEEETLVTDMHGEAVSKLLPAGSYEIVETKPPKGYEIAADSSKKVTIDASATEQTLTFSFINTIKRGILKIRKVDATDRSKFLPGAVFEAYCVESGISYREMTGENGYAVFKDLPYGNYRVREVEAPEGYELNNTFEEYVTVGESSSDGTQEIEMEVPDTPLKGVIQLTKTDSLTGKALEGAVYGIYTGLLKDGDVDPDTHMEGFDMVTKLPNVTSKELPYGTYYVKEITPPRGYEKNNMVYEAKFKANIPLIRIDAEDKPYMGSVSLKKIEKGTKKPLPGAVFAIFTAEEYEEYKKYQQEGSGDLQELSPLYLTTDEKGEASTGEILNLEQEYVMVEYIPPAGYDPPTNADGSEIVWRFKPTMEERTFEYTVENTKRREIIIHKTDEAGNPVNGVLFGLYRYGADGKPNGEQIAQFATAIDGSGIARYETDQLSDGWYYVKELKNNCEGYEPSKEIVPIEIRGDRREYEFSFINYRLRAEIAIQKKDEFGNPLAGARFGLYRFTPDWQEKTDFAEDFIQEFKMNEKGYGKIENLLCDLYVIREIEAPKGYRPMEPVLVNLLDMERPPQGFDPSIHVTEGEKNGRTYYYYHRDLRNEPLTGWIEIQKEAVFEDGTPAENMDLSNARFEIKDESGKVVNTVATDREGRGRSRELPSGKYTITELTAPDGTELNTAPGTVVIDGKGANDVYTYTHQNKVVMGQIKIRKTDPTGGVLSGAEFDIYAEDSPTGENNIPVDHLITQDNGTAVSKMLPYGWYTICETKSPQGYTFDPNLRLRCRISDSHQLVELTALNYPGDEPGVYVIKHDRDNLNHYLKGAQFALYDDAGLTHQIGEPYVTDDKGMLKIADTAGLEEGKTYYLKETVAPEGYKIDETAHSFVWGKSTTIALYIPNEKEKGYIRFEKQGEILSEIKKSTDYPGLMELVWEQRQLENAEIGIYATGEVELDGKKYQTGDLILRLRSGETSMALPTGRYEYQELSAPPSYILKTERKVVEVTKEDTEVAPAMVTMDNTHASVRLQLHKKFSDDENPKKKFEKVKFGVYTVNTITSGNVEIRPETLVGVFGVDAKGFAEPDLKLPQGLYYVKELETAEGYLLDDTRYPFKVTYNNADEEIVISTAEKPIVNEPLYGIIRLEKTGDVFKGVEVSIENNKYQVNYPVFLPGELDGAKVEIRTTETVNIDGQTFGPHEVVDTLISGKKPESRKLPFGTYEAVEVEAPNGYVLDSKPQSITITPQPDNNQVHIVELSLNNEKKKVGLKLYKSFFGIEKEEAKALYEKVLFGVFAAEDIQGTTDSALLRADTLVGLIRIGEDGSGSLDRGSLPEGKYYVKELETAQGYQLDEKEYPFTVSFAKDIPTDENTGKPTDSITVKLEGTDKEHPIMNLPEGDLTPFAFRKVDEEGNPLAGAVFRLYYCKNKEPDHIHSELAGETGSCWKEISGLSPRTSGENGIVDFGLLPDGTYQLRETEAPDGYVLPAGQWRIRVDSSTSAAEHITITWAGDAQPPAFEKADGGNGYRYQVSNRKVRELPFTGGSGIIGYMGGGSVLLAASGFLCKRKKKNKNQSNR